MRPRKFKTIIRIIIITSRLLKIANQVTNEILNKPNQKRVKSIPVKIYMLKTYTSKATCAKYTRAVVLSICLDGTTCINYAQASVLSICPEHPHSSLLILSRPKANMGQPPPEGGVRFLNNFTGEKVPKSMKSLKLLFPTPSMKCISFTSLNFPEHLHIRHPEKIIIIKI